VASKLPPSPGDARVRISVEPPPASIAFPPAATADARGRVLVGGDLEPGTLLAAYRAGLFPMRQGTGELAWWSPDHRSAMTLDAVRLPVAAAGAQALRDDGGYRLRGRH
jgi:Leu/Phe-tRNA-protein transferase